MTIAALLTELTRAGVILTAKADRLAYDAPRGMLTPAILADLKAHKAGLLALLQRPKEETPTPQPSPCPAPPTAPATAMPEAWFRLGASAPQRERFAFDPETNTHPGWWDYLYEVHNRGLMVVNGKVVKEM